MRRVTVAIDVDGVIADFVGLVRKELRLPKDWEPTCWNIAKDPIAIGRPSAWLVELYERPGVCDAIPPYESEVAELKSIMTRHAQRADFVFATSPMANNRTWTHDREAWLRDQGFDDVPVIHTHRKDLVDADVLLDDKPENVVAFAARRAGRAGILRKRPWNESASVPMVVGAGFTRVESMAAFGVWLDEVLT
jgi:5'(3')-deoxyribonucleotidase